MEQASYTAFYSDDHSKIVYRSRTRDLDKLPGGAKPLKDSYSTYDRTDGGDRFEFATFITDENRIIIVQKDGHAPVKIFS